VRNQVFIAASLAALTITACSNEKKADAPSDLDTPETVQAQSSSSVTETPTKTDNVLIASWSGPYGGVPAFDKMNLDALKPALEEAMAKNLAEIDAIANSPETPTFDNTIIALEKSGQDLNRVGDMELKQFLSRISVDPARNGTKTFCVQF